MMTIRDFTQSNNFFFFFLLADAQLISVTNVAKDIEVQEFWVTITADTAFWDANITFYQINQLLE